MFQADRAFTNIAQMSQKAPYPPTTWSLGGKPEKSIDIPVTAICLLLYVCGAATHMTIFQLNRRRGYKFLFNAVLFGTSPSFHNQTKPSNTSRLLHVPHSNLLSPHILHRVPT